MPRRLAKLLSTLSLPVLLAVACSDEGTGTTPLAEQPAPTTRGGDEAAAPSEPETVEAALRLLGEMVEAYRAAPAFVDRIVIETSIAGNQQPEQEALVRLGPGTDMWMRTTNNELAVLDGMLYMTYANIPDKYLAVPLQEDALTTLVALFGRYGGTMAPCVLRYGKSVPEILSALAYGLPDEPQISGYRRITDADDRVLEQISLISGTGSVAVNVDPATKMIVSSDIDRLLADAPVPNFRIVSHLEYHPEVVSELPSPIAFDPGDRTAHTTARAMAGLADATAMDDVTVHTGEQAPDFKLHTLLGEKRVLAEQKGSVVVLVFWSLWASECREAMSRIDQLARWAENEGHALEVWPIHVLGKEATREENWELVSSFWDKGDFSIPSLIDPDSKVRERYGVTAVPITIVVDGAGTVVGSIGGYQDTSKFQRLRELVTSALATTG